MENAGKTQRGRQKGTDLSLTQQTVCSHYGCEILTRGAVWGFFPNPGPEEYPCCRRSRFWPQLLRTELCHRVTRTHAVHSPRHNFFHGQGRQGSQQHSCPAPPSCLSTTCSLQMIPSCVGERVTWLAEKAELCPGVCVGGVTDGKNHWVLSNKQEITPNPCWN